MCQHDFPLKTKKAERALRTQPWHSFKFPLQQNAPIEKNIDESYSFDEATNLKFVIKATVPKSKFQITKCRNKENHITDEANIKAPPRTARTLSLKDTLTVFRKHAKKPTAHLLLLA
ncbi:hypothetical protein TNCV_4321231 [Trichonephila clavipes]|uniref:Uncharacterized protein n=1 Tax=Trichonephila clavipes TaxID=2585209 RepID=A0A8X6VJE0_TRICX|nr:hypothetical protein TNCV_4321231 [Trichonephila clavipes]